MKKLSIKSIALYLILSVFDGIWYKLLQKNNNGSGGGGAPTITRVRTVYQNVTDSNVVHPITLDSNSVYDQPGIAPFDSTTTDGKIGTLYAIIGTNLSTASAIYINNAPVYFNVAEVSNTSILFSIPSTVPYSSDSTSNVLTLVTVMVGLISSLSWNNPCPILLLLTNWQVTREMLLQLREPLLTG